MAATAETFAHHPALAMQAAILARPATQERRMADAIRALSLDAVEAAGSGQAALPMGMADAAAALWTQFHKFDSADPHWPDRDRFVLSAGEGAMLLYSLLHLTGHAGMEVAALRRFQRLDSPAAGAPMFGAHPAIEATTGPLGQGLAMGVGLALAERMMAARFGRSLVDHRTWVVASDAELTAGVAAEAASLAARFRLEKLTVLWDDDALSTSFSQDDPLKRFAAANWAVKRVDGHDPAQVASALSMAMRSKKPTLIACRTIIGYAAPSGAPPDGAALDAARAALGWDCPPFEIPEDVAVQWHRAGARGAAARRAWLKRLATHSQRAEFERALSGRLPEDFHEALAALKGSLCGRSMSTREAGERVLAALTSAVPDFISGSASTSSPGATRPSRPGGDAAEDGGDRRVKPGDDGFSRRTDDGSARIINWGGREHGMAAALNGVALHGGVIASGGASLVGTDSMRAALRLSALMNLRVIHVLSDDGIGLGADGATRQPVEQLAALRAMPNLHVFRPADALETAECWELALRRTEGPSVLTLCDQALPALRAESSENRSARGGYVVAQAPGPRQATLIATGSEVSLALAARDALAAEGIPVAVVSLPCWDYFSQQDEAYRAEVLGGVPRFGIEAAAEFGWSRWLGADGCFIGMTGFGASAPSQDLHRHFGITPDAVAAAVRKRVG